MQHLARLNIPKYNASTDNKNTSPTIVIFGLEATQTEGLHTQSLRTVSFKAMTSVHFMSRGSSLKH